MLTENKVSSNLNKSGFHYLSNIVHEEIDTFGSSEFLIVNLKEWTTDFRTLKSSSGLFFGTPCSIYSHRWKIIIFHPATHHGPVGCQCGYFLAVLDLIITTTSLGWGSVSLLKKEACLYILAATVQSEYCQRDAIQINGSPSFPHLPPSSYQLHNNFDDNNFNSHTLPVSPSQHFVLCKVLQFCFESLQIRIA